MNPVPHQIARSSELPLFQIRRAAGKKRGAEKCETVIAHSNAHFVKGIIPEARNMLPLAQQSIAKGEFEDVAYFEPYYLKEFIATTPKKLL